MKPCWGRGLWDQPPEGAARATGTRTDPSGPDASPMAEAPSHAGSEEQEELLVDKDTG